MILKILRLTTLLLLRYGGVYSREAAEFAGEFYVSAVGGGTAAKFTPSKGQTAV